MCGAGSVPGQDFRENFTSLLGIPGKYIIELTSKLMYFSCIECKENTQRRECVRLRDVRISAWKKQFIVHLPCAIVRGVSARLTPTDL